MTNTLLDDLNPQQRQICMDEGNILLTACPGSGKTRTLTYKLAYIVEKNNNSRKLNIAITYTNRAADEIRERLEKMNVEQDKVWVGTIHQFCLKFIIRPYTMYHNRLKQGYHIIDEYVTEMYTKEIAQQLNIEVGYKDPLSFIEIRTRYKKRLLTERGIDFDSILEISYELVGKNRFISENIAGIIRSILVDEYQDTNNLQYKILSNIVKLNKNIQVIFVGDTDQAIYGNLGGIAKSCYELQEEFDLVFTERRLDGCYRTTQRLIDFYSNFQLKTMPIYSVSNIKDESGSLYYNNFINNVDLYKAIANIITKELSQGVAENEICIVAPRWHLLYDLLNEIQVLLPNVNFDAPDVTPIKYDSMNVFCLITKLLFTESGKDIALRKKIANEILTILIEDYKIYLSDEIDHFRVLQYINSLTIADNDGVKYLRRAIEHFFVLIGVDVNSDKYLYKSYNDFFCKINYRIKEYSLSTDVEYFKRCFRENEGIAINTFYGIKGEEYNTVIAFGLLKGYIPHWDIVYNKSVYYVENETKKLLYVVCSRAKKNIYLFSEQGRVTQSGKSLTPTNELLSIDYSYDKLN